MRSLKVRDFTVEPVDRKVIQSFIHRWHYSHDTNGIQQRQCFALYDDNKIIGAIIYAIPSMPNTAKKYNPDNPDRCWELRRLCCIDDTPTNTESYFIGQTLRWLRQNTDTEVIVSYADLEQGHEGVIYKASNFYYLGQSGGGQVLMVDGKKYHARSLNQKEKPYGRALKRRWDNKDGHNFWESEQDMHFVKTKPKNIYVYYLSKKAKKKYLYVDSKR
ncbi:MAG: hypothetical protein H8D94_00130 [Candidatus Pelagibacter sp.]|nr:hypothetical protein [Candidatus Pelagibacter sp.]